jgi:hypothetical protein
MKIDISKKQVGEQLFTAPDGYVEVTFMGINAVFVNDMHYYKNGKHWQTDKHPTAFNSREEFDEYWKQVKE